MPYRAYQLSMPSTRLTSVVFASPHSGRAYPSRFLRASILDRDTIRTSEDAFVDQLLDCVPGFGAPLLAAAAPRAFVDLNRASDELDPALIEGVKLNNHNPRISSGLGVIPRVVAGGKAIYRGKIPLAEAEARIALHWQPYHELLQELVQGSLSQFGEAVLVDMHSMPHEAMDSIASTGVKRPEIVLGDRYGSACSPVLTHLAANILRDLGYRVAVNKPYAGGFITEHYGRPVNGLHALQIEVNRALYMDEARLEKSPNFAPLARDIEAFVSRLLADTANEHTHAFAASTPLAAE